MSKLLSSFSAAILYLTFIALLPSNVSAKFTGNDVLFDCATWGMYEGTANCAPIEERLCINSDCSLDANGNQFVDHRVVCTQQPPRSIYNQCGCPRPYFGVSYPSHWTFDDRETAYVEKYPYTCIHEYDIIENTNPVKNFRHEPSEDETYDTFYCSNIEPNGTPLGRKCGECSNRCLQCSSGSCVINNNLGYNDSGTYTCNTKTQYDGSNCNANNCNNACQAPPPPSTPPPGATPTPTPTPVPLACGCGYVGQPCCYGQQAADCAGGSRCIEGTCSNPTSGGTCQQGSIGGNNNCGCGDGFIDNNNNGIWDSNEHGAACCGDSWNDPDFTSCSAIPASRDCIQGLVCTGLGSSFCIRFKINGTVFVDDNGNGLFDPPPSGNEVAYQGAKVDYWYGEEYDATCGPYNQQGTPSGACVGQSCTGNSNCRSGWCYTGGGGICTQTNNPATTTFVPDKTSYSQSSGLYEFSPNNSYTQSAPSLQGKYHIIRLNVPSGYSATTPTIQSREVSSGQYADGRVSPANFGIRQYHIGGYVRNRNTQAGIAGVQVRVVNSSGNYSTATTDSNGLFKVSGFIAPGARYAVRVVGNINSPQTSPTGYLSPATAAYFRSGWTLNHIGWSLKDLNNDGVQNFGELDTNIGEQSYESQTAGAGNDCAGADDIGVSLRCSFAYDVLPPPAAPTLNTPSQICEGGSPKVILSWTAPQYATSYQIWRYGNGNWIQIGTTTNLTFDDPTISPSGYSSPIPLGGTTYRYMIRAVNASGTADSNILELTTTACSGAPWIQTQGGDVHSNTGINVKLP